MIIVLVVVSTGFIHMPAKRSNSVEEVQARQATPVATTKKSQPDHF
jgi:hypothetical protein